MSPARYLGVGRRRRDWLATWGHDRRAARRTVKFNLHQTEVAGTAQHTLIGWTVGAIAVAVRELADEGTSFERYDMPDVETDESGIADMGGRRAV